MWLYIPSCLLLLSSTALTTSIGVNGENTGYNEKKYPGFIVFEKDGQYLKVLGPIRGKIHVMTNWKIPTKISDSYNVTINTFPTREIYSLFCAGNVFYEGMMMYQFDLAEDICMRVGTNCPLRKGKLFHYWLQGAWKDTGLSPGWYKGKLNCYLKDQAVEKFHIIGIELKVKIVDA